MSIFEATLNDKEYPRILIDRLQTEAPAFVSYKGNTWIIDHLAGSWAVLGSLGFEDQQKMLMYRQFIEFLAKNQILVVSGFHSPIEKNALQIIANCSGRAIQIQARSLYKMRMLKYLKGIYEKGNMLLISCTSPSAHRPSLELTRKRNIIACALAENVLVLSQNPKSKTIQLAKQLIEAGRNVYTIGSNTTELFVNLDKSNLYSV